MSNPAAQAPPADLVVDENAGQPTVQASKKKFGVMVLASAMGLALLVWSFILPILGILYVLQIAG